MGGNSSGRNPISQLHSQPMRASCLPDTVIGSQMGTRLKAGPMKDNAGTLDNIPSESIVKLGEWKPGTHTWFHQEELARGKPILGSRTKGGIPDMV